MNASALLASAGDPPSPVTSSPRRIASIDVLRGAATLGILVINIAVFAMPYAMDDPTVYGGTDNRNLGAWVFNKLFFEGSMRGVFSLLFGASALLLLRTFARDPAREARAADIYYRRTLWLTAFGAGHAIVLLWPGDVLFVYGLAGLLLYPFRNLRPSRLLLVAALILAGMIARDGFTLYQDLHTRTRAVAAEERLTRGTATELDREYLLEWQQTRSSAHPDPVQVQDRIDGMRGGYVQILKTTLPSVRYQQSTKTYDLLLWDALAMMFLGMALLKCGVLTGERSARFYLLLAAAGYAFGLSLKAWEVSTLLAHSFDVLSQSRTRITYELSRLGVALGHIGVVMLLCRARAMASVQRPLAAVGRMALTNYIAQTVICSLVFYGIGLGLYGSLGRFQLYYVVLGVWALQLAWSTLWLGRFRYGPLEWLWRSLTYWRLQPLRGAARD
jgi:uncharacterized protein